jgi:hypothetical protein
MHMVCIYHVVYKYYVLTLIYIYILTIFLRLLLYG